MLTQVEATPDGYHRTPRGDLQVPPQSPAAAAAARAHFALDGSGAPGSVLTDESEIQWRISAEAAGVSHISLCRSCRSFSHLPADGRLKLSSHVIDTLLVSVMRHHNVGAKA